ncbi:MAG: lamin tail domain-containing protein [Candidatus Pacebacteria bacterium]|nr:lamin tail domain-containing protein [Candidatus Paceibacterota bacterium]
MLMRGVIISEVLPNPLGTDAKNEWIELYNEGARAISLSGWSIKDKSGKSSVFQEGDIIESKSFLVIKGGDMRISLNNDGDALFLYDDQNNICDVFEYTQKVGDNISVIKESGSVVFSTTATPGFKNVITIPVKKTKTAQKINLTKETSYTSSTMPAQIINTASTSDTSIITSALVLGAVGALIWFFLRKKINVVYGTRVEKDERQADSF